MIEQDFTCHIGLENDEVWCLKHNKKVGECNTESILEWKCKKLVEFVKSINDSFLTDDELNGYMESSTPSEQFEMSLILKSRELLKEIGELNET